MKMLYLHQSETAITKLVNTGLPLKYTYRLNLLVDVIEKHLNQLRDFRTNFIEKNGENLEGGKIRISKEKIDEFDRQMAELLEEEVDIKPVEIPLSVLLDTDIKLSALEVEALKNSGFLVDDTPVEDEKPKE